MITVLFFASIREQLGTSQIELEFEPAVSTVSLLKEQLLKADREQWAEVLNRDNVIVAVNQQLVDDSRMLSDGDEVAFFPPVTGG